MIHALSTKTKGTVTAKQKLAALTVLESTGVSILEAAIVAKEILEANKWSIDRAQRCIEAGLKALRQQERTVSFEKAFKGVTARSAETISREDVVPSMREARFWQGLHLVLHRNAASFQHADANAM